MKKNGILTLLFACIPGAGQMYQGYMKRGLSLITMFCLFIILGSTTGLDALVVGCIVVYMYSFFDTLNLRAQLAAEKAPEDDYLVHFNWHDARMTQFMGESHKLVGWGLIALGAIVFYNNIIMRVLGDVMWRWGQDNPVFRAIYLMLDSLPQIVVCVALIVCGMWLVRGPKNKKGKQPPEEETEEAEDFHAYTAAPQAEDAEDTADTDTHFAMPELSDMLYRYFGSARLTNAHNELLTCLVNTGIFGFIFYLGIFVSFIIGSGKKRKKNPVLYVLSLSVICYFVHNMVSFAQVLNFPYLFLFAGMGRYLQKICQSR